MSEPKEVRKINVWTDHGDVTSWFVENCKNMAVARILRATRIDRIIVDNPDKGGDPMLTKMIGPPAETVSTFRVKVEGLPPYTFKGFAAPRDVWTLLRGIALGYNQE